MASETDDPGRGAPELPEVRPYGVPGLLVELDAPLELGTPEAHDALLREKLEYDFYLDAAYDYELEVVEKGIREQAEERARTYLADNGDAVRSRVDRSIAAADLLATIDSGASLVASMTAAELTIRFLLLRPLLAGLVIDPAIADYLAAQATAGMASRDREILPRVCGAWGIDLGALRLGVERELWPTYGELALARNDYVHRAKTPTAAQAELGIACARALLNDVIGPLVESLQLPWPTGDWGGDGKRRDPLAR